MDSRPIQRFADSAFASQLADEEDSFPETDKMPIRDDFPVTDFQDSLVAEEMDQETMPATLYAEFEESRINSNYASITDRHAEEKIDERFWKFDFTDSAQDIKDGTSVKEITTSEDLFNKYFNK